MALPQYQPTDPFGEGRCWGRQRQFIRGLDRVELDGSVVVKGTAAIFFGDRLIALQRPCPPLGNPVAGSNCAVRLGYQFPPRPRCSDASARELLGPTLSGRRPEEVKAVILSREERMTLRTAFAGLLAGSLLVGVAAAQMAQQPPKQKRTAALLRFPAQSGRIVVASASGKPEWGYDGFRRSGPRRRVLLRSGLGWKLEPVLLISRRPRPAAV